MKIFISGVDVGYLDVHAWPFINNASTYVVGLKGDKEEKYVPYGVDVPNIKLGKSRPNLYLLRGGQIKDELSSLVRLRWNANRDKIQPAGFMNFPQPLGEKYTYKKFFEHYESEERRVEDDGSFIWRKKTPQAQNHMWDCRYYNMALRDVLLYNVGKGLKKQSFTWADFVEVAKQNKGR